jgi:hypothetical protein
MKKSYLFSTITASLLVLSGCGGGDKGCCGKENAISNSVNTAPVATFTEFDINADTAYEGQLTSEDKDGDVIVYEVVNKPSHGEVSVGENGLFTYEPKDGYVGEDSFSYRAKDALSSCPEQIVKINVQQTGIQKPAKPSNLVLEAVSTCKIKVSWNDNSNNETGFAVYLDGWLASVVGENVITTNVCGGMKANTTHTISVKAKNEAGYSEAIVDQVTTQDITTAPEAPVDLKVVAIDRTSARLEWRDAAWNETEYDIYVNGNYKKTILADNTHVVITGLEAGTDYTFQVTAKNKIGSNTAEAVYAKTEGESPIIVDLNPDVTPEIPTDEESVVDSVKPVLILLGDDKVTLNEGDTYVDAGATAVDDVDGDITAKIKHVSTVDTTAEGNYTVTYRVSDEANNTAVLTREVEVKAPPVIPEAFSGAFADIKTLLQGSKDGTFSDVTYISIGDSTRAVGEYGGGEIFANIKTALDSYHVNSILEAKSGHTLREWNNYNDEYNSTYTWEKTVENISGDGNHTIVNISLGINDARYFGDGGESVRMQFQMNEVLVKILDKKPNTHFMFTMPHKLIGFDAKVTEIKAAYEALADARGIPLIDTMSAFPTADDLTLYRDEDAADYGNNKRIHLSSKGQGLVSELILKTILP